jgi:hypothetical protein
MIVVAVFPLLYMSLFIYSFVFFFFNFSFFFYYLGARAGGDGGCESDSPVSGDIFGDC